LDERKGGPAAWPDGESIGTAGPRRHYREASGFRELELPWHQDGRGRPLVSWLIPGPFPAGHESVTVER